MLFRSLAKFEAVVNAQIAQLVEQRIENPRVLGSIPRPGTIILKSLSICWGFFGSIRETSNG